MLLRLSHAYDSPGDSVKIQILIQRPWAGVEEGLRVLTFLTISPS